MDGFASSAYKFWLTINIGKAEFMYQSMPGNPTLTPQLSLMERISRGVLLFGSNSNEWRHYQCSYSNKNSQGQRCFWKAGAQTIWWSRDINLHVKISVYKQWYWRCCYTELKLGIVTEGHKNSGRFPLVMSQTHLRSYFVTENTKHGDSGEVSRKRDWISYNRESP